MASSVAFAPAGGSVVIGGDGQLSWWTERDELATQLEPAGRRLSSLAG